MVWEILESARELVVVLESAEEMVKVVWEREWDLIWDTRRNHHRRILGKAHQRSKSAVVSCGGCSNVLLLSTRMEPMMGSAMDQVVALEQEALEQVALEQVALEQVASAMALAQGAHFCNQCLHCTA